jgi:opacity protein-like surface antigen
MTYMTPSRMSLALGSIIAISALTTSAAWAAEPFYVGLQAGYEDTTSDRTFETGVTEDKTIAGAAFGATLGAQYPLSFGYAAIELNVTDSSAEFDQTKRSSDGSFFNESTTSELGYGISTMLAFQVAQQTHVYGLVGYQQQELEFQARWFDASTAVTTDASTDETFGGARYGLGIHHELYDRVGVRLEVTRTDYSEESINLIGSRKIEPEQDRIMLGLIGRF